MSNNIGNPNRVAILVPSCDKYSDLWPVFFQLFWRYWPDCPYRVYLGTNSLGYSDSRVRVLQSGPPSSWASEVRKMVTQIEADYLLIMLEDWFLSQPVNNLYLQRLLKQMIEIDGASLLLDPAPRSCRRIPGYPDISVVDLGAPYRVSLHIAFWRKDSFLDLLVDGENPWQMELVGSRRSDAFARPFLAVWKEAIVYEKAGVNKGMWDPRAVAFLRSQGIEVDLSRRSMFDAQTLTAWGRRHWISRMKSLFPWQVRYRIANLLAVVALARRRVVPDPGLLPKPVAPNNRGSR